MQLTPEQYLEQRLDDQVTWYDGKSQRAQSTFKWLRRLEIMSAAAIPVLAGLAGGGAAISTLIALLGAVVVILAAFQALGQYQENWLAYRTTCESLKHEKYLFLTRSEPYDASDAFAVLVERVESLISKENRAWAQHAKSGAAKSESTPVP